MFKFLKSAQKYVIEHLLKNQIVNCFVKYEW
jgi:hypothetical protein